MPEVNVLSGGAAQGLLDALAPRFEAITGCKLECTFGAVGTMKAKFREGSVADVVILTSDSISDLMQDDLLIDRSFTEIGVVRAALAVRADEDPPRIRDAEDLRAAIIGTDAIYLPDPEQATSGIHFVEVLRRLGVKDEVWGKVRAFPSGAAAMNGLASSEAVRPIGYTQATEILSTPGVAIAGTLPPGFDLATSYAAAIPVHAPHLELAGKLLSLLASDEGRNARERAGFAVS